MELAFEWVQRLGDAILRLFLQPFYYVGILFVILQYRRQILLERKLFSTKLHSLLDETWRTVLWGLAGGFAASLAMAFVGVRIEASTIVLLWSISLVLTAVRVRYLCFAYAAGLLSVLHAAVSPFPELANDSLFGSLAGLLLEVHAPSLLLLAAVLHLLEAVLIRWQGARMASPLFFKGKRGKVIGGYHIYGFWPVPLFLVIPDASAGAMPLPWNPIWSGGAAGWTLFALPVVIGFAEMTISRLPSTKVKRVSGLLIVYSLIGIGLALLTERLPVLAVGCALVIVLLHELLVWLSQWEEAKRTPLYVHDNGGLLVLAVIPSSPADELGIQAGEKLHAVNGYKVTTKEQLYQAMQANSAFCKLEVINLEGQSKFLQRAVFSGEHHQLGIILAPDQDARFYTGFRQARLGDYIRSRLTGLLPKDVRAENIKNSEM